MEETQSRPKIEIKTKKDSSGVFTEIFVDGHKLRGVRSFELKGNGYNRIPTLTLDLNALNLTVDGEFITCQQGYGEIKIDINHEEGE